MNNMKHSLTLLLAAVLGLGALPSSSQAVEVVVSTRPVYVYHAHHAHRVWRRAHWIWRNHHHILIPGHWVTVY